VREKLRGTRWNPPSAAAGDPAQRRTYVFALEPAEQMFRAAAAAASADADAWELDGHGVECVSQTLRGGAGFRVQALSGATAGGGG
jgi:hypothetical protein